MSALFALWLPIVAVTAALFVLSSLLWTVIPIHNGDFKEVPDDEALTRELERQGATSGQYFLPYRADRGAMKSEAFKERYARGPQALIRVIPGTSRMGRNMGLTVVYFAVVTTLIGYVASVALEPGEPAAGVFQLTTTVAVLAYGAGGVLNGVWFFKPARSFVTEFVDAVVYATTTGVLFTLLWPAQAAAG